MNILQYTYQKPIYLTNEFYQNFTISIYRIGNSNFPYKYCSSVLYRWTGSCFNKVETA